MDHDADAKMILTAPPPENWKRPPGRPRIKWLNTVQQDLTAYNLTLNEAVDLAQNHPLRTLMSMYVDMSCMYVYALVVVHPREEEEEWLQGGTYSILRGVGGSSQSSRSESQTPPPANSIFTTSTSATCRRRCSSRLRCR